MLDSKHQDLLEGEDFAEGLELATKHNHEPLLSLLLSLRPDTTISDRALTMSAGSGLEVFKPLVSHAEDFSSSADALGRATSAACSRLQPTVLDYLVSRLGVDVNADVPRAAEDVTRPRRLRFLTTDGLLLALCKQQWVL